MSSTFTTPEAIKPKADSWEVTTTPRKLRRLKALASAAIHALPDEGKALVDTFKQARVDMKNVKQLASVEQGEPNADITVSKLDVAKYFMWRAGMATPYQVGDDFVGLPAFLSLRELYGTPVAYAVTNVASTGLAFAVGMGERKAQQWKAEARGAQIVPYKGPMVHNMLDASVNSSAWNVLSTASTKRGENEPVPLMTPAQIAAMSESYGAVNTAFYAGSTAIPGLESWSAFGVALGVMFGVKGTIRGYQERMADTVSEDAIPEKNGVEIH